MEDRRGTFLLCMVDVHALAWVFVAACHQGDSAPPRTDKASLPMHSFPHGNEGRGAAPGAGPGWAASPRPDPTGTNPNHTGPGSLSGARER